MAEPLRALVVAHAGFLAPARGSGRRARQNAIARSLARETGLAPVSLVRSHILSAYRLASAHELETGSGWYHCAHEIALELGEGLTTGAGIIAALSPQISWVGNVSAARALVAERSHEGAQSIGALGDGISKALRILEGERPSLVLGGRKVRSFYRNIVLPDRAGAVTVDRHAVALALGGIGAPSPPDKWLERAGTYQFVASCYRSCARELGILPHELQATVWLAHRRTLDGSASGNLASAHIRQRRNLPLSDGSEDF